MKRERMTGDARKRTRLLSLAAMMSALGVLMLYFGALFEVLDISMALLASFGSIILALEVGGFYPWAVYGATSVLSILLLPSKFPVLFYVLLLGFYPMVREKVQKLRILPVRLLIKLVIFQISLFLMAWLFRVFGIEIQEEISLTVFWLLANGVFLFYDYALGVMIISYWRVWRRRLRIQRFFGEK